MQECPVCGKRHPESQEVCAANAQNAISARLSEVFELIFESVGDTPRIRLIIANYTIGYMGAAYGLHIPD